MRSAAKFVPATLGRPCSQIFHRLFDPPHRHVLRQGLATPSTKCLPWLDRVAVFSQLGLFGIPGNNPNYLIVSAKDLFVDAMCPALRFCNMKCGPMSALGN